MLCSRLVVQHLQLGCEDPLSQRAQPASNVFLRRLRPSIWLSSMMILWGIVMVGRKSFSPLLSLHRNLTSRLIANEDPAWHRKELWGTTWWGNSYRITGALSLTNHFFALISTAYSTRSHRGWAVSRCGLLHLQVPPCRLLVPQVLTLLTLFSQSWYKRSETGFRVAIFFSSATVAGAFSRCYVH